MTNKLLIKDIAKVTNGKSDVKDAVKNGNYVFFDRSTVNKKSNKFLFDTEAIIIPGEDSREIFEPRYYQGKFDLHQRCYVIYDFKKDFYPKYLFYKLKTLTKHFSNVFVGSTVPSLRIDHIADLKIEFPSFEDQKSTASVLFSLDSKVLVNNRVNSELEEMLKTLYNYWFVQFDFPNKENKPYKSSGGKMIWNEELKREIPEGWKVKTLSEVTEVSSESLNPLEFPSKDFKHYSIPTFDATGAYGIEKGSDIKSNKFTISKNDILVSKLNPWFSRVIYSTDDKDLISSTEFVVWRTKNIQLKNYLYMIAKDYSFITYCTQSAAGTSNSHKRVNPTVMMKYKIVYDEKIAQQFGLKIGESIEMYAKNQITNKYLSDFRDWLLPMLMNGQVKVN
jgi:type I restriction enzyme S subunit